MLGLMQKVVRDVRNRSLRTLLTILGIAVGVAGMVAIVSTSWNVTRVQRALYADTSQANLVYWVGDAPTALAMVLERDLLVDRAELRTVYTTRWRPANDALWGDIELVGIDDFGQVQVNQFELVAGRYPQEGEILLDLSASQDAGIEPGDVLMYRDRERREREARVSGISRSPGHLSSSVTNIAVGYVPAVTTRRLLGLSGNNQLLIRLHDPVDVQAAARRIDQLLRRQRIQVGAPQIRTLENYPGRRELDALIVIMLIFSILGLVLSSFLVANTLSATVSEQIGEIAVLKTVGATRGHILALFIGASLAHGAVGTLLGLGLGALIGWRLLVWIGSLANATVTFRLAPSGGALGLFVGLGVSVLGGLLPALRGAGISIKEALESYGIQADYGQGWMDRALQWLSTSQKRRAPARQSKKPGWRSALPAMALRNLGRRKARTLVTLGVVTLATAAFLGALSTRESVDAAIDDIYTIYAADAWVWFGEGLNVQMENLLTTVEGVRSAEAWALTDGVVALSRARLWGVPAETTLYRAAIEQGRWFRANEFDAVVLSSELAYAEGIGVGEEVEIQVRGQLRRFRVVGITVDNTIFLGGTLSGKVFMPREALNRLLANQHQASFYALSLDSREPGAADEILARLETRFARFRPHVQPVYAEIEAAQEASRLLTVGLAAMVLLVALVGGLGVLNTLTLNVLERRREIAVLRAIGATDAAVMIGFLVEGLALGVLGWVLGLIIGYPLGQQVAARMGAVLFQLDFTMTLRTVVLSVIFTLGLSLLASLAPALAAAQTSTSAALRYE
jgi:putative ABC transport system permease protein